jgi:predicted solute-binding protein
MAPAKKAAKKAPAKKAPAKKAPAKKAPAKKAAAKKAPAKKAAAKKAPAKKAAKKAPARKAAGPEVRVPVSQVKEYFKSQDLRVSSEFAEALNAEVAALLGKVAARTKANNRATVRPGDL